MSISLNRDALIYMLDKLPVPDLLRFLKSNLALMQDLLPVFTRKINAYELEFDPAEAASMANRRLENKFEQMKQINLYQSTLPFPETFILLDDEIVKFMHLGHMPRFRDKVLYSPTVFYYWWHVYFEINGLRLKRDVLLTPELKDLARTDNDQMGSVRFLGLLLAIHSRRIHSPPTVIPETNLVEIDRESQELLGIFHRLQGRINWGTRYS